MKLRELLKEDAAEYRPPTKPMQLMADFYVLGFLSSGPVQSTSHRQDGLDFEVRHVTDTLLPYLKNHLLEMAGNSIYSELTHVFDYAIMPDPVRKSREVQYGPYDKHGLPHDEHGNATDYQAKIANYLHGLGIGGLVDDLYWKFTTSEDAGPLQAREYHVLAKVGSKAFRQLEWEDGFGGEPWAMGCDTWSSLYSAMGQGDVSVYCDKIYSIQHNNGAFLDKNRQYQGDWVQHLLNVKFDARDPEELIRFTSPHMRRLALMVLKSRYGRGWDRRRWGDPSQGPDDLNTKDAIRSRVFKALNRFELEHQSNDNVVVYDSAGRSLAHVDFSQIADDNRIRVDLWISEHPIYIWSHNTAGVVSAVEGEEQKALARQALEKKAGGVRETA